MAVDFPSLAGDTLPTPETDVFVHRVPNESASYRPACCACSDVGHVVDRQEDLLLEVDWNEWPRSTAGHVAEDVATSDVEH